MIVCFRTKCIHNSQNHCLAECPVPCSDIDYLTWAQWFATDQLKGVNICEKYSSEDNCDNCPLRKSCPGWEEEKEYYPIYTSNGFDNFCFV